MLRSDPILPLDEVGSYYIHSTVRCFFYQSEPGYLPIPVVIFVAVVFWFDIPSLNRTKPLRPIPESFPIPIELTSGTGARILHFVIQVPSINRKSLPGI